MSGPVGWQLAAAAVALSAAGVAAPIAVAVVLATNAQLWRPLVASALVALLVLAPAGTGLASALAGLQRVRAVMGRAGGEAENAVLRVLAATALFGYALAIAAGGRPGAMAAEAVPIAAVGLIGAWCWLLCVILWPVAPASRHYAAIALDIALFSALLHAGGGEVAGWYPLYLLIILYSGLRCGVGAMLVSALAGAIGFAAVVLSTESWHQQPLLAAGLLLALMLLPALVAGPIRALAAARSGAAEAAADRERMLRLIAEAVRVRPSPTSGGGTVSPAADILDLAALEAGRFVPPIETFELREQVAGALAPIRLAAAGKGIALRYRIDPHLPNRVRGPAQAFARIVGRLAGHAVDIAPGGMVRLAIDAAGGDARRVRLRLSLDGLAEGAGSSGELAGASLALRLVRGLVELLGGELATEREGGLGVRWIATLSLQIEESAAEPMLDLRRRPVLVTTEDSDLAAALRQLLTSWNAEPLWLADADAVLAELPVIETPGRAIVIADGRSHLLSVLSLAHRAARLGADAPFVLVAADNNQIASLSEVDDGEVDGFVPLPVTAALLANAFLALPLAELPPGRRAAPPHLAPTAPTAPNAEASRASSVAPAAGGERITSIAAHPRFAPESQAAVDPRVIDGLRALGGGPGFLHEVIDSFRADARQIMERIGQAVAAADPDGFGRGLMALHRAAGPLGGAGLCELAASLQRLTASELRQHGAAHLRRLDTEVDRLAAALIELVPAGEARRS